MDIEKLEQIDLRASSTIHPSLAQNILVIVLDTWLAKEFWKKIERIYQEKCFSNWLSLKEQFYNLHMDENAKVLDHLSILNGIVSELEIIRVTINYKDKAMRLI